MLLSSPLAAEYLILQEAMSRLPDVERLNTQVHKLQEVGFNKKHKNKMSAIKDCKLLFHVVCVL